MSPSFWGVKAKQFNALQAREKVIVAVTTFLVFYLLFNVLGFSPSQNAIKKLNEDLKAQRSKLAALRAEEQLLNKMLHRDPIKPLKNDLDSLNTQVAQLDDAITKIAGGFVPASQLPVMLKEVLTLTNSVQLEQIITLPPQKIPLQPNDSTVMAVKQVASTASALPSATDGAISLYRQGVMLQMVGEFGSLLSAIQKIEQSPWHIYWDSLHYRVKNYPTASMQLQLYTLTLINHSSRPVTSLGEDTHDYPPQPH